jgi:orotidine-5'-phosphate decarboxylase
MSVADHIIVALDVPTEADAIALVDQLPNASFFKVGLELFISVGPSILLKLKERQKSIFLDLKLHDIPNTMAGACRAVAQYGVDLLTVHAQAGKVGLEAAVAAAEAGAAAAQLPPPKLLAVTLLTSIDPRQLAFDLKIPLELSDYVLQMGLLAQDCGVGGIVCSPQEVEHLQPKLNSDLLYVCPGVRPAWAQAGDQRRLLTPAEAIQTGATHLVIGRPITAADSPAAAFDRICQELQPA